MYDSKKGMSYAGKKGGMMPDSALQNTGLGASNDGFTSADNGKASFKNGECTSQVGRPTDEEDPAHNK